MNARALGPGLLSLVFVPTEVAAREPAPVSSGTELDPQPIVGGSETATCAWPSVVHVTSNLGNCTGTLVHPRVVLTAGHCIGNPAQTVISVGEVDIASRRLPVQDCKADPGWTGRTGQGTDFGYCLLSDPVTDIPVTPVMFGCEGEGAIVVGADLIHVGYGRTETDSRGRKKELRTTISSVSGDREFISTPTTGESVCSGDSGGPAFMQVSDGSWRLAGVISWASPNSNGCGGISGSGIAARFVDYVETQSGVDITPCFEANGAWAPTFECGGFPLDPGAGGGNWGDGCEMGPLVDFSSMCGPSARDTPDGESPTVTWISPAQDADLESEGGTASLVAEVEVDDGDGWGVESVELFVTDVGAGTTTPLSGLAPYRWPLAFPRGTYDLEVVATDYAGNEGTSEVRTVTVDGGTPDGGDGDGSGSSDGSGDGDGDPGGESAGGDGDGDGDGDSDPGDGNGGAGQLETDPTGCACSAGGPNFGWTLLALGLLPLRRRRR